MKDDFYIGWSNETPKKYLRKAKQFFAIAFVSFVLIGVVYVKNQRGYIDSHYNYDGTLNEISGYLVKYPTWGLRTEEKGEIKTIPLIGFGKKGVEQTILKMMETYNIDEGTMITLRGMLIYYQDKYLMELPEKENLVSVGNKKMSKRDILIGEITTLEGEIVDPKCFFGVMNPATKAVHRSCAIRCISGGISPLLAIRKNGQFVDYYFIHGKDMQSANQSLLPYVGLPIKLSGQVVSYDDWKSLIIDPAAMQLTWNKEVSNTLAFSMCY